MKRSPRELEHEVRQLKNQSGGMDDQEVGVEWCDADPEGRPEGMAWDPDGSRIEYDFWSAQQAALAALGEDADLVALLGGYRSGKSVTGARWLLTQALSYPGTRHLAMGIDFAKAVGSTYRVLFQQLPPVDVRTDLVTSTVTGPERSPIVSDYHRGDHRLTLVNGSVIKLGAADVWNRYAGDEYSAVWLDEPSHYDDLHSILEMVGSRLTAKEGPKRQFWTLTGNGYNDAWEILEERQDEEGDAIGLGIEVVRASVRDNPYLSGEDVERLERQFEDTGREKQALEGGFAAATGLVYSEFSRDTHVIDPDEAAALVDDGDGRRYYGYDAGWRDPRVIIEAGKSPMGQLVVLDEYYAAESHVEDAVRWLESGGKPRGKIFAEHEPADIRKFQVAGWQARKAEKSLDAGIAEVRGRLEVEDGRPGLLVSGACENLIREFLGYQREQVGTSSAVDHGLDALRYLCMGERGGDAVVTRSKHKLGDIGW